MGSQIVITETINRLNCYHKNSIANVWFFTGACSGLANDRMNGKQESDLKIEPKLLLCTNNQPLRLAPGMAWIDKGKTGSGGKRYSC